MGNIVGVFVGFIFIAGGIFLGIAIESIEAFMVFFIFGFMVILISLATKPSDSSAKINNKYEEDRQFAQEEIHAHDFTSINEDDISQSAVHEHKGWEADDGPIKYK